MAVQSNPKKYLNQDGLAYFYLRLKEIFVQGEEGMGLSHNDFTDELKTRLDELDPEEVISEEDALTYDEIDEILNNIDRRFSE